MKRSHRDKELTEVQSLKKENKRLKEEIRSIQRRNKQLERIEHIIEIDDEVEDYITTKSICPACNKGNYEVTELVGRKFSCCDQCGFRSKAVKVND